MLWHLFCTNRLIATSLLNLLELLINNTFYITISDGGQRSGIFYLEHTSQGLNGTRLTLPHKYATASVTLAINEVFNFENIVIFSNLFHLHVYNAVSSVYIWNDISTGVFESFI